MYKKVSHPISSVYSTLKYNVRLTGQKLRRSNDISGKNEDLKAVKTSFRNFLIDFSRALTQILMGRPSSREAKAACEVRVTHGSTL